MPRVDTKELRAFVARLHQTGGDLREVGPAVTAAATFIMEAGQTWMPSKSGRFRGSWSVIPATRNRAYINSSGVPHAAVQEFGGWVRWKSKNEEFKRVPINGNIRMLKSNAIRVKTPIGYTGGESYFIYPAAADPANQPGLEKVVSEAITKQIEGGLNA